MSNLKMEDNVLVGDFVQHGGSNGGGNDMLEKRIDKLEQDVAEIKTSLAVMKSNYATREDLHKELGSQTKWIAATFIGTISVALAVAKYLFS